LVSDSISIRSYFLSLLLEFIWTTYPGNLYPIGLPDLTQLAYLNPTRTPLKHLTRALPNHINAYPALYVHTWPNYLTRFFSRSDFYLLGLTRSYPAELPYMTPLSIRLLLTRPYTVLPDRITLPDHFSIGLLPTRSYPAILPNFLTRPGNTSLHPTAYPALPNHLTRPGTLQPASPKKLLIVLPP
jgi:hypothetical protein